MGVLIGEANVTRFSYIEYQAIMLCLAGMISVGLLLVELTMKKFHLLPLLFPGMFSIRERRFYFFDFEISNGPVAERLRSQAKMLVRMTLCVVASYLWQHCVMDTTQQVGTEFPRAACQEQKDCFASELQFSTLVRRSHEPVDCSGPREDFAQRVVVTCIHFVSPSASQWLMHFAIAHSVTQLNLKCFELSVWIAGNSKCVRRLFAFCTALTLVLCLVLFFGGAISEFASSWLSFVTMLSMPVFFFNVWRSAKVLQGLWLAESRQVQVSIEEHLNAALADFAPGEAEATPDGGPAYTRSVSMRARNLLKLPGMRYSGAKVRKSLSLDSSRDGSDGAGNVPATPETRAEELEEEEVRFSDV